MERFGRDFDTFCRDYDYYDAVSMRLMQIGELSAGLTETFWRETGNQVPWMIMKGMRNQFAHAYIAMDKEIIWKTALEDIPVLLRFCENAPEDASTI